jgi:hypothetical protein
MRACRFQNIRMRSMQSCGQEMEGGLIGIANEGESIFRQSPEFRHLRHASSFTHDSAAGYVEQSAYQITERRGPKTDYYHLQAAFTPVPD